ncbi:ATP-binding cassette sub-family B member 10, mitochondrial-like [Peromyscus californicus insignis]|uniref:ATP-binding cassette sub-family B member 10, mitochondrial-like n=1 Tax=Peromyscus californicus insignis TaxID=564181 RepID=UPI0022A6ABF3|nr:ATP-binding cassette sub-family B member 10, mitochondrial-like [Peromyscus californicus insignis]
MDGGGGGGASHGLAGLPLMRSAAARGAAGPREAEGAGPGVGGLACGHPWREQPGDPAAGAEAMRRAPHGGRLRARAGRRPARRHAGRRGPVCAPTQGAPITAASCPPCAPNSSTAEFPVNELTGRTRPPT